MKTVEEKRAPETNQTPYTQCTQLQMPLVAPPSEQNREKAIPESAWQWLADRATFERKP